MKIVTEDWRNGTFYFDHYSADINNKVSDIKFSILQMIRKHPEEKEDLRQLITNIRDEFDGILSYSDTINESNELKNLQADAKTKNVPTATEVAAEESKQNNRGTEKIMKARTFTLDESIFEQDISSKYDGADYVAVQMTRNDPNGEYTSEDVIRHPDDYLDILLDWKDDIESANDKVPGWLTKCINIVEEMRKISSKKKPKMDKFDIIYFELFRTRDAVELNDIKNAIKDGYYKDVLNTREKYEPDRYETNANDDIGVDAASKEKLENAVKVADAYNLPYTIKTNSASVVAKDSNRAYTIYIDISGLNVKA